MTARKKGTQTLSILHEFQPISYTFEVSLAMGEQFLSASFNSFSTSSFLGDFHYLHKIACNSATIAKMVNLEPLS